MKKLQQSLDAKSNTNAGDKRRDINGNPRDANKTAMPDKNFLNNKVVGQDTKKEGKMKNGGNSEERNCLKDRVPKGASVDDGAGTDGVLSSFGGFFKVRMSVDPAAGLAGVLSSFGEPLFEVDVKGARQMY